MGYKPRHKLAEAVASLPLKTKATLVVLMAGCAVFGGLALGGISSASINNGHVYTSNGEAGWFTWSGTRFDEVHADVSTNTSAEQSSTSSPLGNGVALCALNGSTGYAAQLGEVWNAQEHAFDVVWAEGTLVNHVPDTNGNACTAGGSLNAALTFSATGVTCTPGGTVTVCGSLSPNTDDIPLGDKVYLQVRQWNTHLQFEAQDLSDNLGITADNEPGLPFYAHYAQAGTIFDLTARSAPASVDEADFSWVRASDTTTGEGETQGSYFSVFSGETVISNPSGSAADPGLVVPTLMNPHVAGGLGCFALDVGSPVGA